MCTLSSRQCHCVHKYSTIGLSSLCVEPFCQKSNLASEGMCQSSNLGSKELSKFHELVPSYYSGMKLGMYM